MVVRLLLAFAIGGLFGCRQSDHPVAPARAFVELKTDRVHGRWFMPDQTPRLKVVVLGGSEGGIEMAQRLSIRLAEQGHAALAVGYFAMPELPPQLIEIPLEAFDDALDWVAKQPPLDAPIALIGTSKGAEAALLVASTRSDLAGVVAVVPSSVVWQGLDMAEWRMASSWTRAGQPLKFVPYDLDGPTWPIAELYSRSLRQADAIASARIPVENISAPLLLLSGEDDQIWPSYAMALQVERAATQAASVEHYSYEDAGHAVLGRELDPNNAAVREQILALGGTFEGNQAARRASAPKLQAFLEKIAKPAG
jgi:uncharacterized protein